jgi:phosphatidylserine/phosphatidylglycerophosphate/cardiolipin synthase-like enzyme
MRKTATSNGVLVKAYAGATGVILAMNIDEAKRKGLLGFAIERYDKQDRKKTWLPGKLNFPGKFQKPGTTIATRVAPIQKFRWSDYGVEPDGEYAYTIYPVYGAPEAPKLVEGPTVKVRTASAIAGEHRVLFNRAAAASQAFSKKFPETARAMSQARRMRSLFHPPTAALNWLSRGVLEQILDFIERAGSDKWALDLAIYECELREIVETIKMMRAKGAQIRIVYHAKPGDAQTEENERHLAGLPKSVKRPRVTSKICHHKFMVLSKISCGVRRPQAVLTGSTNFTENGVYRQANVVHVLEQENIAQQYLNLFEDLWRYHDDPAATRKYISSHNSMDETQAVFAGFSPRSGGADLQAFAKIIQAAKRDVLFCTAFDLYDGIERALLGAPHDAILRYGLQNTRSKITGYHADQTAKFVATAMLSSGLEGWLKETRHGQRGNILIHTKIIIVDFTSKSPVVISGSHNLSEAASKGNDENFLIVRGNTDVADCYGCELLRLYEHYRFRFYVAERLRKRGPWFTLQPDDSWTNAYFGKNPLKTTDRLRFAGEAV